MNPFDYIKIGKEVVDAVGSIIEKTIDAKDKHIQSQANIELLKINNSVNNVISEVNAFINVANSVSEIVTEQKSANANMSAVYSDIEIKIQKSKADFDKSKQELELKKSEINEEIRQHKAKEIERLQEISHEHEEKMFKISEKYKIEDKKVSSEHELRMLKQNQNHEEEMARIANERARIENESKNREYEYNLKKQWLENQIESIHQKLNIFIVYINTIIETNPPVDIFLALTTQMKQISDIDMNMQSNLLELKEK